MTDPSEGHRPSAGHRIAKLLARAGVASRRDIERMIAEGRVALHGTPLTTPATVLPSLTGVTVDGAPVAAAEPARLFLFHKPVGVLTAERDPRGRATIYDRLPAGLPRLVPVGRLDLNTEGLLLMTTDGGLKRQLELPATGIPRVYRARVYGHVAQGALEALIEGIEIEGVRYGSIDANMERRTGANAWIEMRLAEGKNREVRRVLEHLGLQVGRLIRTAYGPFVLGDLPAGGIGEVRSADLAGFQAAMARGDASVRMAQPRQVAVAPPRPAPRAAPRADGVRAGAPRPAPKVARAAAPRPQTPAIPARPAEPADDARAPRPARIKRQAGWAKPKPKPGPKPRRRPGGGPRPGGGGR